MSILTDCRPVVEPTLDHAEPFVPTAEDWAEVAAWRAATEDPGDFDGLVPLELLVEPCEAEDLEEDGEPWWLSLPTDPVIDTPIELGPEAEPVAVKVRGERFTVDVNGDPDVVAHGYVLRDRRFHNAAIRRFRWFADAQQFADELNACEPRSRASWNPERDAAGLS